MKALLLPALLLFLAPHGICWADDLPTLRRLVNVKESLPEAKQLALKLTQTSKDPLIRDNASLLLAECEYREGNTPRAFSLLEGLSMRASDAALRPIALLRLAMLQMDQDMGAAGFASYEQLARRFPQSDYAPMAMMIQANYLLLIKGEKNQAISAYEQLAKNHPGTQEGKLALAALPDLRKMSPAQVRETKEKYTKNLQPAKKPAKPAKSKPKPSP